MKIVLFANTDWFLYNFKLSLAQALRARGDEVILLSPPGEVHRMAGGMFTISYSIAVLLPVVCGACWDLTGRPWSAFMPIAVGAVIMTVFGTMLTSRRARQEA